MKLSSRALLNLLGTTDSFIGKECKLLLFSFFRAERVRRQSLSNFVEC